MGNNEQAFRRLDQAFEERAHWLVWIRLDPRWDSLRSDQRYTEMTRRMGFLLRLAFETGQTR